MQAKINALWKKTGRQNESATSSLTLLIFLFFRTDWEEEQVSSPNILRLIYQGRFLHGNVTLGGEKTLKLHHPEKMPRARRDMHTESLLESSLLFSYFS